jgi:hypothetical protein
MNLSRRLLPLALALPAFIVACSSSDPSPGVSPDGGGAASDGPSGGGSDAPGAKADVPTDPAPLASAAAAHVKDIVNEAGHSFQFATEKGSAFSTLSGWSTSASKSPKQAMRDLSRVLPKPLPSTLLDRLESSPLFRATKPRPLGSFLTAAEAVDETANDLEVLLRDRLLTPANLEAQGNGVFTYLLHADPTCKPLPSSVDSSANTPPAIDADCAEQLPKLQIRLEMSTVADGTQLRILVGPNKLEVSVFVVGPALIAWEMDLGMAKAAADFVQMALAKPGETVKPAPVKLAGRVRSSLRKLGPEHAAAAFSVLQDVSVEADDPMMSVKTAKADPLFGLDFDGVAKKASIKLGFGQTDVQAPWDPKDVSPPNRDLHVSVGALGGELQLEDMVKQLTFKGLGVGATFVDVRDKRVFQLDLNPADGRKFDATVTVVGKDNPRVAVNPKVDLSLAFHLDLIAAELTEQPPKFLLSETYSLKLLPAPTAPAIIEGVKEDPITHFEGGVKMVAASLELASSAAPAATVSVPSGKCLSKRAGDPPQGSHELLGALAAVDCPQ